MSGGSTLTSQVNSSAKTMPVKGERMVPPIMEAIPTNAHNDASWPGRMREISAPRAPPMMSNGASTPPDVPEPSEHDQIKLLTTTSNRSVFIVNAPRSKSSMMS